MDGRLGKTPHRLDNFADSPGSHILKEAEGVSREEVPSSTLDNFFVRFLLVLTFVAIVLLLPANLAFMVSVIWGFLLLALLSYGIVRMRRAAPYREIAWHLAVASLVIVGSRWLGDVISHP